MNQIIENILTRRSIRKYLPKDIPQDFLCSILECGLYAPCAGGRQGVILLVCKDKEINRKLGVVNKLAFRGRISTADSFISNEQPSIADDITIKSGFYEAPVVLTLFGARNFLYAKEDCAVAAENMMLAAHSLGIGSCMLGRATETFDCELGKELLEKWEVPKEFAAICHVLLGYYEGNNPAPKERKKGRIIFGE